MKVQGACHCCEIRYEAEVDPETVLLCNCTDCQVLTGSAFRLSVPAPRESFKLLSGEPRTYIRQPIAVRSARTPSVQTAEHRSSHSLPPASLLPIPYAWVA